MPHVIKCAKCDSILEALQTFEGLYDQYHVQPCRKCIDEVQTKLNKVVDGLQEKLDGEFGAEIERLRRELQNTKASLDWHKTHTHLDGGPSHPRPIKGIIVERDDALAELTQIEEDLGL